MGRRRYLSLYFCAVAAVFAFFTLVPAQAAPPRVVPTEPCLRSVETAENPYALITNPAAFDCKRGQAGLTGRYTWGLVTGLSLATNPQDPWELRHEYSQADTEAIFVRYADGRVVQAPSDRMTSRRLFSPGMVSFALPADRGTITAVLIRVEGLRNQRGIAPSIEFKTGRAALDGDLVVLLLYGVLAGIVGVLLVYNIALYVVLRYRFIFAYCLSAVTMLGIGLSWSGGIFLVLPNLNTTDQISLTLFGTMAMLGTAVFFLHSFIEEDCRPRRALQLTFTAAIIGLVACSIRLIDSRFAWQLMDRVTYLSMAAILTGLLVCGFIAWRNGSGAAKIYLAAWSIPLVMGIARAIWAMGLIGGVSIVVAMSPLIFIAIEALMSALAVSWRVGRLRTERDEARAMQARLQQMADTDALTGLLNRGAFIRAVTGSRARTSRERLMVIDIDEFKRINDRHGHQAGDDVLVAVAAAIRATAPPDAHIGRLGGEEFSLLVAAEPVDALPERLCRAVEAAVTPAGHSVTISIGVADGQIDDDVSWRIVYYAADQALYRSKNGGRNRVSHAPRPIAA